MDQTLFKAILAMDAYNRGYDASIDLRQKDGNGDPVPFSDVLNVSIGSASIATTLDANNSTIALDSGALEKPDGSDRDDSIGFYALAYAMDTNGDGFIGVSDERIISYRGTDRMGQDAANGWLMGGGQYSTPQGMMALDFYQSVASSVNPGDLTYREENISLTGHSLGGGLGGFIGALYDQDATIFDSMAFSLATDLMYASSLTIPLVALAITGDGSTHLPDYAGINGYFIEGEVLDIMLPFRDTLGIAAEANPTDLGYEESLSGVQLHSMSSMVIRLFADYGSETGGALTTDWKNAAQYFWPVLYDGAFARDIGMGQVPGRSLDQALGQNGETQDTAAYGDILRAILAYSAIPQEFDGDGKETSVTVFGDTGIRALYDDANELGAAITAAGAGSTITEYATDISKAFVQYVGQLALSKINQGDDTSRDETQGILHYDPLAGDTTLTIDFSDALWTAAGKGTLPNMVAVNDNVANPCKLIAAYA